MKLLRNSVERMGFGKSSIVLSVSDTNSFVFSTISRRISLTEENPVLREKLLP